jgi:hypothetical protein
VKSNRVSSAGVACHLAFIIIVLVTGISAQEKSAPGPRVAPQDWTQGHIVFTRDGLAQNPGLVDREPRILQQVMKRWQTPNPGAFNGVGATRQPNPQITQDWTITALGGRLRPDMFPAKFTFDPTATPSCRNDYIVFGLAVPGVTTGQANLVAFNNLYVESDGSGLCPGMAPTLLFAYNITTQTGGKIVTSPVMTLDGTKIAFVESVPGGPGVGQAIFHVVTWSAGAGTIGGAAAPALMTSVPLLTPGTTPTSTGDSTSSPWLDYNPDIVYVGADNGYVYQITSATSATPVLSGSPWPSQTGTNYRLTSPILDSARGLLMVGSSNGNLYQVNTSTAVAGSSPPIGAGGTSSGIIAPPIVDVTNGTTFVIDANDGTSAVLVELDTATDLPIIGATANIGLGASGTSGVKVHLYQPTFSNNYYTNPSGGFIATCGTGAADTTPWAYSFGFTGRIMDAGVPLLSFQLSTTATDGCTGWTEFFNPNIGVGGTDFFYFGLTTDCTKFLTAVTTGCVAAVAYTGGSFNPTAVSIIGGPSGIVVDNYDTAGSSIYFNSLSSNVAYKYTDGLQ